jgi:hypothetical protein
MRLKIRRLNSTIPLPSYATGDAAGFDLAAAHDTAIAPGQLALVRTGLVVEVPTGHFLAIVARSSTPLKRGLIGTVRDCGPSGQHWLVGSHGDPTSVLASSTPTIPALRTKS